MSAAVSLPGARRPARVVARGWFVTAGYQPDGDTLRFVPDRARDLGGLLGVERLVAAKDGSVPVRLEGIDAPELHDLGQEQPGGWRALEVMLKATGIPASREAVPGAIVARRCDRHGRAIAYVFRRGVLDAGGMLTDATLRTSVNARMLETGAAYALAYRTQPPAHRRLFRELAMRARAKGLGVWPLDRTLRGVTLRSPRSLGPSGALVFPKLFRRCAWYLAEDCEPFTSWLARSATTDDWCRWTVRARRRVCRASL